MAKPLERPRMERVENLLITSTLLLMVVVTVQPILNLLAISFSDPALVPGKSGLDILPSGFSTQIWEILILHPSVLRGLANSALITVGGTLINVALTAMMAYAMSRPNLPGRRLLYIFVLITIVFEPGIVPDYFVMKNLGLLGSYWSVLLYKAVNAWYLILLIRFFEEVPQDLIEAAEMDGANAFQVFWSVVLPLTRPALATITLFYLVFHWNEFFRALIYLSDQDKWPLQVVLRQFVVEGDKLAIVGIQNMGNYTGASQISARALKAGMILITIAPILVVYPLILKFFTKGTMSGALKG